MNSFNQLISLSDFYTLGLVFQIKLDVSPPELQAMPPTQGLRSDEIKDHFVSL